MPFSFRRLQAHQKRTMKNILLISFLIFTSIQFGLAQDVSFKIIQVNEQRHTGHGENKISIIVAIDSLELDADHLVQVKDSILAVDNTGRVLEHFRGYPYGGYFQEDKELSIGFKAPRRDVTEIEKLEGILEYFTISEKLKSKVILHDFINHTNENLLAVLPPLKLILINYNEIKKVYGTEDYYPEIKRIHQEVGIGKTMEETDVFFSDMFYFQNNNPELELNFYIEDPDKIIHKITVYNGDGKPMSSNYSNSGNRYRIGLSKEPLPDWKLEIHVKTKAALKEIPFHFSNIKMP